MNFATLLTDLIEWGENRLERKAEKDIKALARLLHKYRGESFDDLGGLPSILFRKSVAATAERNGMSQVRVIEEIVARLGDLGWDPEELAAIKRELFKLIRV